MLSMQIAEQSAHYVLCQTLLLLNLYEKAVSLNKYIVACLEPTNIKLSQTLCMACCKSLWCHFNVKY